MEVFVGLDVGGTQIKGGALRARELSSLDPALVTERLVSIDTELESGVERFFDRLADFARQLGFEGGLGIGFPGIFRTGSSVLLRSANMEALAGIDLGAELAARLDVDPDSLAVCDDANLAAYGEQWLGAGRGLSDLVLLTLGTGIGGGILLDGKLFTGPGGRGAEIGHLIVRGLRPGEPEEDGLRCGCGAYGCLERLASATATRRRAAAAGLTADLPELARAAREGPGPERELWRAVGRDLGQGILNVTTLLDISTFVVAGGLGAALDVLLPGIEEALAEREYGGETPRIVPAELGTSAGWIGAVRVAIEAAEGA